MKMRQNWLDAELGLLGEAAQLARASRMITRTRRSPLLRSAGVWTMVLGSVHVATVGVFYPASVRSILKAAVLSSVDADPALVERRGVGFWYLTSGLLLIGLGAIVRGQEKTHGRPPPATAPVLLATGVWGILLTPTSGFWAFLPIAWLARASRQSTPRPEPHRKR